jgi:hypothetical protein
MCGNWIQHLCYQYNAKGRPCQNVKKVQTVYIFETERGEKLSEKLSCNYENNLPARASTTEKVRPRPKRFHNNEQAVTRHLKNNTSPAVIKLLRQPPPRTIRTIDNYALLGRPAPPPPRGPYLSVRRMKAAWSSINTTSIPLPENVAISESTRLPRAGQRATWRNLVCKQAT